MGTVCILASSRQKNAEKINELLKDIDRNKYEGIGKPKQLTGDLAGLWSRRIDDKNRIIYKIENEVIKIYQCGSHYGDK